MNMNLYSYSGDPRRLNKYLNSVATVNIIAITDDTDILNPAIIINTRAFNFNYVYIPAFNRYYFVNNIDLLGGERIKVSCRVDVLMSHKSSILSSTVLANRSSSNNNPYLKDDKIPCKDKATTFIRNMGNTPFNTTTYVLSVGGK